LRFQAGERRRRARYDLHVNAAILFLTLLQTSTETWVNTPRPLRLDHLEQFVDVRNTAVYKSAAAQLIRETIGIEPRDLTFVIQVVRWSDGAEMVKQNWYVYHAGPWSDAQFETQRRIYGRKQVWFLYIQLNARSALTTTYVIETKKKSAAYFDHLQQAAGLFGASLPTVGEARNIWNAKLVDIPFVPSDLVIGGVAFDNEGLSWIDFSAAVPVKQPGMFAVVDLYLRPTDIKGLGFGNWPHAVEGVRVGNRPLKSILLGVGWGPVYGGVVVGGGMYTYSFGLNISIAAALKK
jgi:hypothetical protein